MEKEIVYVKKALQFSKVVTFILLVMSVTTWLFGFVKFWLNEVTFVELADYTKDTALNMMPYFCLAASDRFRDAAELFARHFKKGEEI